MLSLSGQTPVADALARLELSALASGFGELHPHRHKALVPPGARRQPRTVPTASTIVSASIRPMREETGQLIPLILAMLEYPRIAPRVLAATGHLADLTGAARINVLVIRIPPMKTILPTEEILSRKANPHPR